MSEEKWADKTFNSALVKDLFHNCSSNEKLLLKIKILCSKGAVANNNNNKKSHSPSLCTQLVLFLLWKPVWLYVQYPQHVTVAKSLKCSPELSAGSDHLGSEKKAFP